MSNRAVIGLGYGDEGKGVVTEYLCSQDPFNTAVVRFSGGQQAAHTVHKGDTQHIFHHLGSGTLSGCPTYWSEYCTFNPWILSLEWKELVNKGFQPKIYVHPKCAVTTPYDMYPGPESLEMKHGTCGHGIFRTKQRHVDLPITVQDLSRASLEYLMSQLLKVGDYYKIEEMWYADYWNAILQMRQSLFSDFIVTDCPPHKKNLVFEGSQGLMLDEHIGHMPHCTPSDITPRNAMKIADLDEVFLVTRCYQTRHGNGPMTNEDLPVKLTNDKTETCLTNEYQGKFRKSVLDLDQLVHAKEKGIDQVIFKDTKVNLVVTCMDQMDSYPITFGKIQMIWQQPELLAKFLKSQLNINGDAYINTSPRSDTIQIFR